MSATLFEYIASYYLPALLGLVTASPVFALLLLNKRLQPGKLDAQANSIEQVQHEVFRSLRRLSRTRTSVAIREEVHRKLLQFQAKVRFSEAKTRRRLEAQLERMLREAARYGITVSPDESMVRAA